MWSTARGGGVTSGPCVSKGRVYAGNNLGQVYCINEETGTAEWVFDTASVEEYESMSAPAVFSGNVYVSGNVTTSSDNFIGHVYCINADNGTLVWKWPEDSTGRQHPVGR